MVPSNPDSKSDLLIWVTGASFGMNLFCSEFTDYVEADIIIKGVIKVNRVVGIVTTIHKCFGVNSTTC